MTLTVDELKNAVPANMKNSITQDIVDRLNNATACPDMNENIKNNFISFTSVMKEGRFSIEEYINAVQFVSYRLMNDTQLEAWAKTFPGRYAKLIAKGAQPKDISSHVSSYSKGKLVNLVLEQSIVPSWVLNQHFYQEAILTQVELMKYANSEKVRTDAANSLLTHLKRPEVVKSQVQIELKDSSGMNAMREQIRLLAEEQRKAIESGVPIQTITDQRLLQVEKEEDIIDV